MLFLSVPSKKKYFRGDVTVKRCKKNPHLCIEPGGIYVEQGGIYVVLHREGSMSIRKGSMFVLNREGSMSYYTRRDLCRTQRGIYVVLYKEESLSSREGSMSSRKGSMLCYTERNLCCSI